MSDTYISFHRLLTEDLPPLFIKSIPSKIREAYVEADKAAHKPLPELYLESLADEQGLWAQCALNLLANSYTKSGLQAELVQNKKKRSHLEITTSRTLITIHRVRLPGSYPPHAHYRRTNAALNQLVFDGIPGLDSSANAQCNLHLLHGPDLDFPERLGFVQLAVPEDQKQRYLGTYSLYFSDSHQPVVMEEIRDTTTIRLKTTAKTIQPNQNDA